MTGPCPRPECGGEVHTDGWGTPIQCPASRRCPRCDCADGHTQCEHCKTCTYAVPGAGGLTVGVTRVHTDTGSHIEPELDEAWDEETKLRWHAAVVAHDTGLTIEVHPHTESASRTQYGINIGSIREGGQTSLAARPYYAAWNALTHISIGAEAARRAIAHHNSKEQEA
ncbi:hypothetical protein ACFYOF_06175 [Streptomyces sp. NPDC007148]|uniref:hypothetical protein n=1 Tax=Streptomyces sp. NPDC007148 TaxID=3364775 RepID=UPI0036AF47B0